MARLKRNGFHYSFEQIERLTGRIRDGAIETLLWRRCSMAIKRLG